MLRGAWRQFWRESVNYQTFFTKTFLLLHFQQALLTSCFFRVPIGKSYTWLKNCYTTSGCHGCDKYEVCQGQHTGQMDDQTSCQM